MSQYKKLMRCLPLTKKLGSNFTSEQGCLKVMQFGGGMLFYEREPSKQERWSL